MPGETIDEMTEQQVSTVEEDLLNQSKPDLSNSKSILIACYYLIARDLTWAFARQKIRWMVVI